MSGIIAQRGSRIGCPDNATFESASRDVQPLAGAGKDGATGAGGRVAQKGASIQTNGACVDR